MSQPAWLEHAWAELGQREVAAGGDNPRIVALYRDAGFPDVRHDEVAWCAAFVGACLERAGMAGTHSLLARSFQQYGEKLDQGQLGAIVVLSRGADPGLGHVAFWIGETSERVYLLGGNQGDAVSVQAFDKARILDVRWPTRHSAQAMPAPSEQGAPIFEKALAHVLEMEGGWSEDPYDTGGPTNFGITLADYSRWRGGEVAGGEKALVSELKAIKPEAVRAIYRKLYWEPSSAGSLPPPLAVMHFDAAVNHGLAGAARMLQRAVGATVDSEIGPETLRLARSRSPRLAIASYAEQRRAKYRSLSTFWRFGRGWLARADATETLAISIIDEDWDEENAMEMPTEEQTTAIATAEGKWWGDSVTMWGVLITTLSTVLPVVGPLIGLDISAEAVRQLGEQATAVVQAVGGLAGTLLTIYGRARATAPLVRRDVSVRI